MGITTISTKNLSLDLKESIEKYARKLNISEEQIIEKAIKEMIIKLRKAEYIESFKKANNDKEMLSMAEMGLDDYLNLLEE